MLRRGFATPAVLCALLVAACSDGSDRVPPRQTCLTWPEGDRLYVADSRQGVVRSFATADGPRAVAEGRAPGRSRVFDLALDGVRRRLWVLGPTSIDVHDAMSLALIHSYPVAGVSAAGSHLRLDDFGRPALVAGARIRDN